MGHPDGSRAVHLRFIGKEQRRHSPTRTGCVPKNVPLRRASLRMFSALKRVRSSVSTYVRSAFWNPVDQPVNGAASHRCSRAFASSTLSGGWGWERARARSPKSQIRLWWTDSPDRISAVAGRGEISSQSVVFDRSSHNGLTTLTGSSITVASASRMA